MADDALASIIQPAVVKRQFKSRKQIEEKIMTILKGEERDMIGICGMGGLGKTFMANSIRDRALKEDVFDEVVIAVVSQHVDEFKIQLQIAEQLGLCLVEKTLYARSRRIRMRLNDSKRTLLILDDVWECPKLVELGIPCDSERCRIIFTSRNSDVLSRMDVGKVFGMEILSEEEAWLLFKEKSGSCVDDMKLNSIAKDVVKECKGLPIALVIVGTAMKDEMDESIWKDAVKQLMKTNPKNVPDFIKEVYNPLEVSYTKLASEEAKSVLLLCCLFPEDAEINLDTLIYFCMGLGIFENVESLDEARNMMQALIMMLKNRSLLLDSNHTDCVKMRSLLLDSNDNDCVKMHDVVRDVCIFMAKQKGYIGGNECTWNSSFGESDQLPVGLEFPHLSLLMVTRDHFRKKNDEDIKINTNNINTFSKEMKGLHVLSVERYRFQWHTQTPMQSLKNLRTLILKSCLYSNTLSFVGDLVNLEILICQDTYDIKEFPVGIGRLSCLKLLDLTDCRNLQSIGRGIISSLVGLEELKMLRSFRKWEPEDKEDRKNAGLRELESLTNLSCLEIEIEDLALVAENMHLSSKLERFQINIRETDIMFNDGNNGNNALVVEWMEGTYLGNWIQMQLLRSTQILVLSGDGVNNVELVKIPNNIYASLVANLSEITISECSHLNNLGQLSTAGYDCFPHLENLRIMYCEVMEQVFLWNEENKNKSEVCNHQITKIFPKLKEVHLENLPNLTTLCQGIEGIGFPLLVYMYVIDCPKMTSMISCTCLNGTGSNLNNAGDTGSAEDDEKWQVSFGSLKVLQITKEVNLFGICHSTSFNRLEELEITSLSSMSLFTSSIVGSLVSLKELCVHSGDEMLGVIQDDDEEIDRRTLVFPNLQTLDLINLGKLVTFCQSNCDIEFPSLKQVMIRDCPNMTNFTLGNLIAPNWETWKTNLNHCLDVSYMKIKKLKIFEFEYPLHHYKIPESFFTGLEELSVTNYNGYMTHMSLFTSSIVRNLINLRELCISDFGFKQVIEDDDDEEEIDTSVEMRTLVFPNLQRLCLDNLQKMVTFCESRWDVEFPSLKKAKIMGCPIMENFTLRFLIAPNWEAWETDLKHCLDVSSMKIKKLEIIKVKYPLLHYKISESFFAGLEELSITYYDGSMSLLSSSIVRNLVNLRDFCLYSSYEIIQVINDDEEEEKVVSGGEKIYLFPKLQILKLFGLIKLVTFCECNCDVVLPSLKKVEIRSCPKMTNFTLGSLTTPILANIMIDYKNFGTTKDLNGLLQQRFGEATLQLLDSSQSTEFRVCYSSLPPSSSV